MSQTTIGSVSLGLDPAPLPLEALCGSGEEKTPQGGPSRLGLPPRSSQARHLGLRGAGAPFSPSRVMAASPDGPQGCPSATRKRSPARVTPSPARSCTHGVGPGCGIATLARAGV